jgi:glycosyltransferase involved in cell wall biosynthesis
VICTRNRARQLTACLAAVGNIQSNLPWELLLVDNGSSDETSDVIDAFLLTHTLLKGHHLIQPIDNGSLAKNLAIAASEGEIIAFTDDDCYPASDFIDRVHEIFAAEPLTGFIGGRIMLHDPTDAPLTINESLETALYTAGGIVPNGAISGANMAFRRVALVAVGGFDPTFGAGTRYPGEDWDICARVCMSGWNGGYYPSPVVSHHHGRKAKDAARTLRGYHYGGGAVFAKLVTNRSTRWPYLKHWARRTLGDSKAHKKKLVTQFRGAFAYWFG